MDPTKLLEADHRTVDELFAKIEKTLPAKMKQYMNDIPHIFVAKAGPTKKPAPKQADSVAAMNSAAFSSIPRAAARRRTT